MATMCIVIAAAVDKVLQLAVAEHLALGGAWLLVLIPYIAALFAWQRRGRARLF